LEKFGSDHKKLLVKTTATINPDFSSNSALLMAVFASFENAIDKRVVSVPSVFLVEIKFE
jgi:hypothetical protein